MFMFVNPSTALPVIYVKLGEIVLLELKAELVTSTL